MSAAIIPNPTTMPWVHARNADNMCGFAAFVQPINEILAHPHAFYGPEYFDASDNPFIALCLEEFESGRTYYPDVEIAMAAAIKRAFARATQDPRLQANEASPTHPFTKLMNELLNALIKAKFIVPAIEPNFHDPIKQQLFAVLEQHTEALRPVFRQFQAATIATVNRDAAIFLRDAANNEDIPANMRAEYAAQLKANTIANSIVSGQRFQDFIAPLHLGLMQEMKAAFCNYIYDLNNAYTAAVEDLVFMAWMLGCVSKVTLFEPQADLENHPCEYALNPDGAIELFLQNTGFHWQAAKVDAPGIPQLEILDDPEMPALEPISASSSPVTTLTSFTPAFDMIMSNMFGNEWNSEQCVVRKLADQQSEIYRIQQDADEFVARTHQMNELLDDNSSAEIISQTLASFRL